MSVSTQIKITLPEELFLHVRSKAEKYGLNLASYIRHLVINDVKDIVVPEFKMSEKREKITEKALSDYNKGKTKKISDLNKYFDSLK